VSYLRIVTPKTGRGTLNPKILSLEHYTQYPKPYTLNPKP